MVIRIVAFSTSAKARTCVKIVNITRPESIVIDAKMDFIDHVERIGMIRMLVNVSQCKDYFNLRSIRHLTFLLFNFILFAACDCSAFSLTGNCTEETGKCECKLGYHGSHCATCSPGYVGYPDCQPCSADGTSGNQSKPNECSCKPYFTGAFCEQCICSDFKYPHCNGMYSLGFFRLLHTQKNQKIFCSEIGWIKSELANVEDLSNFTENCRSTDFGLSFLHVAAMHDLTHIITELVRFGANVDSVDRINQTPIFYGIALSKQLKYFK